MMPKNKLVKFYLFVFTFVLLYTFGQVATVTTMAKGYSSKSSDEKADVKPINTNALVAYQLAGDAVVVRNGFNLNGGKIQGSVRQLLPQSTTLNSQAFIAGNLFVPGTPTVTLNGTNVYNGTTTGNGLATPTNYNVTLNGNVTLKSVVRHSDAITISNLPSVPTPTGTRDVSLNPGGSIGDPATLRNLTVNSNVGNINLPPGTYGNIILNSSNNTLILGTTGQNTVYNLQAITLNAATQIQLLGTVTLNVNNQVNLNSSSTLGNIAAPASLVLNVSNGGLTVNTNSHVYGSVYTPTGTVTLNSSSSIRGLIVCNFFNGNASSIVEALSPDTTNPTISVDQPTENAIIRASSVTVTGQVTDDSVVTVKVNGITATVTGNSYTVNVPLSTFGSIALNVVATDGFGNTATTVRNIQRADATNQAPVVNAGSPQTVSLGTSTSLSGVVSDDGKPTGSSLIVTWQKISGPGTVTFADNHAATTTATFSIDGTYVLQLSATDGQLTSSSLVTITVTPTSQQNTAPTVTATPSSQTITLPQTASVSATIQDDGQPAPPGQTTIVWSKTNGPVNGTATFSNPTSLTTTVTFSVAGTYTLHATASDSALSATSDVTVIVNPPQNQAPVVSAGQAQTVLLPADITLTGTASDDNLPSGTLTTVWSKVSGPGSVVFETPQALTTLANFSQAGIYVLRLTATDGALSSSSDVTVTLNQRTFVIVYSRPEAFDNSNITLSAKAVLLMVRNRTGVDGLTYTLTQGSQTQNVTIDHGGNGFISATLVAGSATLTVVGHPEWVINLTVTP